MFCHNPYGLISSDHTTYVVSYKIGVTCSLTSCFCYKSAEGKSPKNLFPVLLEISDLEQLIPIIVNSQIFFIFRFSCSFSYNNQLAFVSEAICYIDINRNLFYLLAPIHKYIRFIIKKMLINYIRTNTSQQINYKI